jgi:glycosyltransferase involved in cell wall biosynthesis
MYIGNADLMCIEDKVARHRILLTGNTCFKIANFREGLVRALISSGHEVIVLAPTDPTREKLISMGCRVLELPMERNGTSPLAEAVLLLRIYRMLRDERPTIVFGYTIKNNIYAGLACSWLGIPFVPNVTGLGPAFNDTGLFNRVIRLLYRAGFARARMVFFQNPEDQAIFLRSKLILPKQSRLLPGSGVDLDRFAACSLPPYDEGIIFLFVARLLWDKGLGLFVDAARVLRGRHPSIKFQVLGPIDTASRSSIPPEQIHAWVEEGVIDYLGETSDVRPALSAAHCIVLPTWYREGTPRILLEAAAIGRPAITTDTAGCKDAVIDGETGFICDPRSLDSLIAALEGFVSLAPETRSAMGSYARSRAEADFDEKHVIAAYIDLLRR